MARCNPEVRLSKLRQYREKPWSRYTDWTYWLILATFCTADASHSDPCEESGPCGSRNMIGERVADLGSGVIIYMDLL